MNKVNVSESASNDIPTLQGTLNKGNHYYLKTTTSTIWKMPPKLSTELQILKKRKEQEIKEDGRKEKGQRKRKDRMGRIEMKNLVLTCM